MLTEKQAANHNDKHAQAWITFFYQIINKKKL